MLYYFVKGWLLFKWYIKLKIFTLKIYSFDIYVFPFEFKFWSLQNCVKILLPYAETLKLKIQTKIYNTFLYNRLSPTMLTCNQLIWNENANICITLIIGSRDKTKGSVIKESRRKLVQTLVYYGHDTMSYTDINRSIFC